MTAMPFARARALLPASIVSLAAILVLAGPAAAHHGRHRHHSSRHFHHHFGSGDDTAGTIASFDPSSGKLVINLAEGDTASGFVTPFTRIDCGCDHSWDGARQRDGFESSDDHGWDHGDWNDDNSNCTTANLVAGAIVDEATLELTGGRAFFEKVALDR